MTLLELLLVMAILAVVLGTGLGVFSSLDFGKRQARGFVKNVLRSAQNSAIARQAPARVHIDVARNTITAEAMAVVGTWRFENKRIEGVSGLDGEVSGGTLFVEDGFLGDALYFDGNAGTLAEIPVQLDPAFDFTDGFSIECELRREDAGGGKPISVGEIAGIDVTNEGRVRGWFIPRVEEKGEFKPGGPVRIESEAGLAPVGEWMRVKLEYDRANLVLTVDGLPVASYDETAAVWPIERPLILSARSFPFHGAIDDLVISCVIASEETALPDSVAFSADTPRDVWFGPGGGLDRARHPGPAILTLEFEDGHREQILVGAYGTVDG
jgi:hypothetical protein